MNADDRTRERMRLALLRLLRLKTLKIYAPLVRGSSQSIAESTCETVLPVPRVGHIGSTIVELRALMG